VLRQDPNVIMVGEIRDPEVAKIVGQAAFTGHLVLSSLHTGDCASAVTRLINLGLEPYKVAECLSLVVAQRLIRTLCPDCRTLHDDVEARRLGDAHGMWSVRASAGPGCERCRMTGYIGRVPLVEMLVPDEQLCERLALGGRGPEIRAYMRTSEQPTMRDAGLEMIADGITSVEELERVIGTPALRAADTKHTKARFARLDTEPRQGVANS
jgi:type II secretory ATPase GspE/PulE/Tfp pilus assembly ATPase PilB-like protein